MPKDRIDEKLLRHDQQFLDLRSEFRDSLENFRIVIMEAVDQLVAAAGRR